jgi:hypothetical protein
MIGLLSASAAGPSLPQGIDTRAVLGAQAPTPEAKLLFDLGVDPNDLPRQRWALVAPAGPAGDAALEALAPLRERRSAEQGAPARVMRLPEGIDEADLLRWREAVVDDESLPLVERPRYLLLVGDADRLSFGLQRLLSADRFVGRLPSLEPGALATYADKALAARPAAPATIDLFTADDGSLALRLAREGLMKPTEATLAQQAEAEATDDPTRAAAGFGDAGLGHLQQIAQGSRILFTCGHGEGPPPGGWSQPTTQRERQGALHFGAEALCAERLGAGTFVSGGLWLNFACHGAGTPRQSGYRRWMVDKGLPVELLDACTPQNAGAAFTAGPSAAAIFNPHGPLSIVGHVDLAFTYSFVSLFGGARGRSSRFSALLRQARRGDRLGVALSALSQAWVQASVYLTAALAQEPASPALRVDQGLLWLLREDIANFVLLGDPACRLVESDAPVARMDWEQAVLRVLLNPGEAAALAAAAGRSVKDLQSAAAAYQRAGRATLGGAGRR